MATLTSADGNVNASYTYNAFGNEAFPDPDDENPFRYCGEYYDKGTNRLYLQARDYDAGIDVFKGKDILERIDVVVNGFSMKVDLYVVDGLVRVKSAFIP